MGIKKEEADKIIRNIKRKNRLLEENEETKYNLFKDYDPFAGEISESLLNGNDVAKYALVTGMLTPFNLEKLSGVTYSAGFSGNMYYYDQGKNDVIKKTPDEEEYYEIRPNSITYLEIDTVFRVPNYMVLRFNLRVKNVYKGLLLGTGPIIDSGFVGRIFIPLHNLTSNTYRIKKGAKLIEIEFTKISSPQICLPDIKSALQELDYDISAIENIDFSGIPPINNDNIGKNREFETYITKSLSDHEFGAKDNVAFVCNSISNALDEIDKSREETNTLRENVKKELSEATKQQNKVNHEMKQNFAEEEGKINEAIEKNEQRESIMRSFSVIALIAMLLTAIGLGISAASYFYESSVLKIQCSTVQDSIDNTDSQVDIIAQALDTIAQNTLFADPDVQNEFNDIVNKLKSNNISTGFHNTTNQIAFFFTLSIISLVLSSIAIICHIVIFIKWQLKIKQIESKYSKLEIDLGKLQTTYSEDNSNERAD